MTSRGLKPWQVEQAQRYLPPDRARARSRRGYELASAIVAAALAGEPVDLPPEPVEPVDLRPELRRAGVEPVNLDAVELTACRVCHRPHDAPPDTVCDRCDDTGRRS